MTSSFWAFRSGFRSAGLIMWEGTGPTPPLPYGGDRAWLPAADDTGSACPGPPSSQTLHPWVLGGGQGRRTQWLNSTRSKHMSLLEAGEAMGSAPPTENTGSLKTPCCSWEGPLLTFPPSSPESQGKGLLSPGRGGTSAPNPGPIGKSCSHFLTYCLCGQPRQRS